MTQPFPITAWSLDGRHSVKCMGPLTKSALVDGSGSAWSDNEILALSKYYKKIPTHVLAKELGRKIKSVRDKAYNLGLAKKNHE